MERAEKIGPEKIGLGVAVAGHVALFALLSLSLHAPVDPARYKVTPVDVSLVDAVGLEASAPQATELPAQSKAPEQGPPEDAAPPAPAPEPVPQPEPQPPTPAKPAPAKPAPPKPAVAVPKKPAPKAPPKPSKPAPTAAKPTPAKAAPAKSAASPAKVAAPAKARGTGANAASKKARPTGSLLDDDFRKGLTQTASKSTSNVPMAAKIDAHSLASIQQAIQRQIQPCADRQVIPGPGATDIVTVLNLRLNRNGTLGAVPTMVRQSGTDDQNERYAKRVVDLGVAAFKGCSPLRLPPEFYATPTGGWGNINYIWKLGGGR